MRHKKIVWFGFLILMVVAVVGISQSYTFRNEIKQLRYLTNVHSFSSLHCLQLDRSTQVHFKSDQLTITGDLYPPASGVPSPCIILLHGSSLNGRKLPLMQVMAAKFQQMNFMVLNIDLRGYGESDDPPALTSPKDFNFAADVIHAIDFLSKQPLADTSRIFLIGHSFGAGVALAAMQRDKRIKKLVLIGPPRRLRERFFQDNSPDREYFLKRWQKDMQLSYPLPYDLWQAVYQPLDIENYLAKLSEAGHIPIMFIDGAKEDPADLQFLRRITSQIAPPVTYWTVPDTDHYLNTGFFFSRVCYDSKIIGTLISHIRNWITH